EAIAMWQDDLLFSRWIDGAHEQLSCLYAGDLSREEKVRAREKTFRSLKGDFRTIRGHFQTGCYPDMEKVDLNNASLMAYWQYFHGLERFEALYQDCGGDLRKVVDYFKEIRRSGQEPADL
ncbi:MAG: aminopeptidase, partial [candidate division NC10 bacterium]|nr:aminopeptidase [candidate division NC10 bacterium]